MSLLEKIKATAPAAPTVQLAPQAGSPGREKAGARPVVPCPVCKPPRGRKFWLDGYGQWTCWGCHPPAVPRQVRGECVVGDVGEAVVDPWELVSGFRVIAVEHPDRSVVQNPNATTRERREALEALGLGWGRKRQKQTWWAP